MSKGYILLHREITDNWLWQEKPFSKCMAWISLLLKANHTDGKILINNTLQPIPRGSFMTSIAKLSEDWGWDRKKTMRFLDLLESDEMITKKGTTNGTTITIVNYSVYQDLGDNQRDNGRDNSKDNGRDCTRDNGRDNERDTSNKLNKLNTLNKLNKNNKAQAPYFDDPVLNQSLLNFIEMRKKIRSPLTDNAIKLLMNNLEKLAPGDNDMKAKILDQSTVNSWKSVYPLKTVDQIPSRVSEVDNWV